jgi:hypothetical protein
MPSPAETLKTQLAAADITHLATQLNATLDIPWVPESFEQKWIEWVLAKAISVIPAEVVECIVGAADGLTESEIAEYEVTITNLVNKLVDLPVLSESMEAAIIRPVVNQLLSFAVKGKALTLAL